MTHLDADRNDWKTHNQIYIKGLLGTLLRVRFAREQWLREHFELLCTQWGVHTAVELAEILTRTLTSTSVEEHTSIIYIGMSIQVKRPYIGLVENRNPINRFEEHWRQIQLHKRGEVAQVDHKYSYMASTGGCQWLFLPLLSCGMVIPKARLETLEKTIYKRFPNALNFQMRTVRKGGPAAPPRGKHGFTRPPEREISPAYTPRCYQRIVPVVTAMQQDGSVSRSCDLFQALSSEVTAVVMHTSYPWSTTNVQRYLGSSIVQILSDNGDQYDGPLRQGLKTIQQWHQTTIAIIIKHRILANPTRPEDYDFLLACCKQEIPRSEWLDLSVEDLWKMYGISCREVEPSAQKTHIRNCKLISKELRTRGITLQPHRDVVVKLPSCSKVSTRDVRLCLKAALRKTFLPQCVCDHLLSRLRVVWSSPRKLGAELDNGPKS